MSIPRPKKKRLYQKVWFWLVMVVALAIVGAIVWAAVADSQNKFSEYDNLRQAVAVEKRDLSKIVTSTGTIKTDEEAMLLYPTSGDVTAVNYSVGDEVVAGDVLVTVDAAFGSDQDIEAPFDGRVLSVSAFDGAPAITGQPAVTVGYRSTHVEFLASEGEVIDLEVGQDAELSIPSYNNGRDSYEGEVTFVDVQKQTVIGAAGSSDSGYLVKVSLGNVPSELQQVVGLTVDMEIEVGSRDGVLSLETGAVHIDEDNESFVYTLPTIDDAFVTRLKAAENEKDVLNKKYIDTDFRGDEYIEVTDGLRENEEVLLYIPAASSGLPF